MVLNYDPSSHSKKRNLYPSNGSRNRGCWERGPLVWFSGRAMCYWVFPSGIPQWQSRILDLCPNETNALAMRTRLKHNWPNVDDVLLDTSPPILSGITGVMLCVFGLNTKIIVFLLIVSHIKAVTYITVCLTRPSTLVNARNVFLFNLRFRHSLVANEILQLMTVCVVRVCFRRNLSFFFC